MRFKLTRDRALLAAVLALALLLRLWLAADREWIGYDEANYLMIAQNARADHGWVQSPLTEYHPKFHLLSFLVPGALGVLIGDDLLASKLLFVLLGTLAVFLVALLGKRLFSAPVGIGAAAFAAVAPVLTSLLGASISHTLYLPLMLAGAIWAWDSASGGGVKPAALSGLAIALGWWARADGLIAAPATIAFLIVGTLLMGSRKLAWQAPAAFAVAFGALYVLYDRTVIWLSGGAAQAHNPIYDFLLDPIDCSPSRPLHEYSSMFELALAEPQCILARVSDNAELVPEVFFTWTGFPLLLLPLIGAAMVDEMRPSRETLAAHALLLIAMTPLLAYLPFYLKETRYMAPYAAIAFLWCSLGLLSIGRRLEPHVGRWGGRAMVLACALGLLAITMVHKGRMSSIGGREYVEAGNWISANTPESTIVWTSQSQLAYYAHRPWLYPPRASELTEWPRDRQILLAVDGRNFADKNSVHWKSLIEAPDSALSLLHTTRGGDDPAVRIYRVDTLDRLARAATALVHGDRTSSGAKHHDD